MDLGNNTGSGSKNAFMFSPIFEREEDCQDNPFVFEKFELADKTPTSYDTVQKAGYLLRMKKKKVSQPHSTSEIFIGRTRGRCRR